MNTLAAPIDAIQVGLVQYLGFGAGNKGPLRDQADMGGVAFGNAKIMGDEQTGVVLLAVNVGQGLQEVIFPQ